MSVLKEDEDIETSDSLRDHWSDGGLYCLVCNYHLFLLGTSRFCSRWQPTSINNGFMLHGITGQGNRQAGYIPVVVMWNPNEVLNNSWRKLMKKLREMSVWKKAQIKVKLTTAIEHDNCVSHWALRLIAQLDILEAEFVNVFGANYVRRKVSTIKANYIYYFS